VLLVHDPRDGEMRRFLTAIHEVERWESCRLALATLVVLVGLPALFARGAAREICAAGWIGCAAMFVVATIEVLVWRRRCARYQVS
jgi:hypothetical protein